MDSTAQVTLRQRNCRSLQVSNVQEPIDYYVVAEVTPIITLHIRMEVDMIALVMRLMTVPTHTMDE